jgi:predicted DNA-binding transcriptional regulator AlpA
MTILTVQDVAELLKMSPSQIYSMTKARGRARMKHPIPILLVNGNLRFSLEKLEEWVKQMEEK